MGELALVALVQESGWAYQLTTSQGFEMAYPIYELLEHVKGPVLQNQSCRISMIQGILEESP